jgi:hypothetical protein
MYFILIVKNLFSFYVELEILLHFLLFCRLWNVNKDVNMRNYAWNKMDRTYTKKSSEKHFWTRITDRNYQIADRNNEICSLVCFVKKVQKLRTAILKCQTAITGVEARTCSFKAIFSLKLRDFYTTSSQISLKWLENRSQARKKRKNTIGEEFEEGEFKNRTRNHRSFWCIFFFTLCSYCAVV